MEWYIWLIIIALVLWGLYKIGSNESVIIEKRNEQLNKLNDWKEKRR